MTLDCGFGLGRVYVVCFCFDLPIWFGSVVWFCVVILFVLLVAVVD